MFNTHLDRRRYLLAALLGAAAGGLIVSLSTRAVPKMMSGMMVAMMHKMMPEMERPDGEAGDMCKRMMAGMGQAPQHATCDS